MGSARQYRQKWGQTPFPSKWGLTPFSVGREDLALSFARVEVREVQVDDGGHAVFDGFLHAFVVLITQPEDAQVERAADGFGGVANPLVQADNASLRIQVEVAEVNDDAFGLRHGGRGNAGYGQRDEG